MHQNCIFSSSFEAVITFVERKREIDLRHLRLPKTNYISSEHMRSDIENANGKEEDVDKEKKQRILLRRSIKNIFVFS